MPHLHSACSFCFYRPVPITATAAVVVVIVVVVAIVVVLMNINDRGPRGDRGSLPAAWTVKAELSKQKCVSLLFCASLGHPLPFIGPCVPRS